MILPDDVPAHPGSHSMNVEHSSVVISDARVCDRSHAWAFGER